MKRNYEIKSRISDVRKFQRLLKVNRDYSYSVEQQVDIYFKVKKGRLKLRIIDDAKANLIYYHRKDSRKERVSRYAIAATDDVNEILLILRNMFDVIVEVSKTRMIFISDNVRIHLDKVKVLGNFVEIEIIYEKFSEAKKKMKELILMLGLNKNDFIECSYSDLIIKKK